MNQPFDPRTHVPGWGADLDRRNRPAVPMERTPPRLENVHWDQPSPQPITVEVLKSTERPGISPVFGSTLPPRGLSGVVRRLAFRASENDLRRWLLLMLADRINRSALRNGFDHIVLAADPSTLGEIRRQLHKEVDARMIAEVAKDWTNTPLDQIEKALHELRVA